MRREGLSSAEIVPLKGDGSARRFVRLKAKGKSLILILPQEGDFGLREARAYAEFSAFLRRYGVPAPEVLAHEEETGLLLVEDLGDLRLFDLPPEKRKGFYPEAIRILARLRELAAGFPREFVLEGLYYDAETMWEKEARYFLEAFLTRYLGIDDLREFEAPLRALWARLQGLARAEAVLHRDFQSKNLMVKGGRLYVIDFQGLRLGPSAYDLASLLIDPYVALSPEEREGLLSLAEGLIPLEREAVRGLSLFRNLQALGAFAKLTLAGKTWFAAYIPQALRTLKEHLALFPPEGEELKERLAPVFEKFGL